MAAPTQLFLEFNDIDGQFHVNDHDGFAFGNAYEPVDAIKHARIVTKAPIQFNEFAGIPSVCVTEKPDAIADHDVFISALAELAGMKVVGNYDDNMNFIGYSMELIEDEFVQAELAAEQYENDIVSALGSFMEDD